MRGLARARIGLGPSLYAPAGGLIPPAGRRCMDSLSAAASDDGCALSQLGDPDFCRSARRIDALNCRFGIERGGLVFSRFRAETAGDTQENPRERPLEIDLAVCCVKGIEPREASSTRIGDRDRALPRAPPVSVITGLFVPSQINVERTP